jgi:hypothetical protein
MAIRVQIHERAGGEDRSLDARAANDRIAEKARQLQFVSGVPMMCECSSPDCHTIVQVALPEYEEIRRDPENFLVARGHEVEGSQSVRTTESYEIRRTHRRGEGNGHRRSA